MFRPAEFLSFSTTTNARVLVAFTGATTVALLGLGLCAGSRAALIGMLLWATLPIVVFYERLVLQDPAVAALVSSVSVLIALFARTAQPHRRSALAFGAGLLVGTAVLVKLSAVLALPWLGLALFAMQRESGRPAFERSYWLVAVGAMLPFLFLGADLMRLGARLTELGSVPDYKSAANKLAIIGAMAAETKARVPVFFVVCGQRRYRDHRSVGRGDPRVGQVPSPGTVARVGLDTDLPRRRAGLSPALRALRAAGGNEKPALDFGRANGVNRFTLHRYATAR